MAKIKVTDEEMEKLLEHVYFGITITAEEKRENFSFEQTYGSVSEMESGPLKEYYFFEKKGDKSPKMLIWCLMRKKTGPTELFAISDDGQFRINSFVATIERNEESEVYRLKFN